MYDTSTALGKGVRPQAHTTHAPLAACFPRFPFLISPFVTDYLAALLCCQTLLLSRFLAPQTGEPLFINRAPLLALSGLRGIISHTSAADKRAVVAAFLAYAGSPGVNSRMVLSAAGGRRGSGGGVHVFVRGCMKAPPPVHMLLMSSPACVHTQPALCRHAALYYWHANSIQLHD